MYFVSTRGDEKATGAEAIVRGLAGDGGLFVPEAFPEVSLGEIEQLVGMSYPERAAFVIGKYLGELGEEFLAEACKKAYSSFEGSDPAPLVRIDEGLYILELFHGPTCAFKDGAYSASPFAEKELRADGRQGGYPHSCRDERGYGQGGARRL